MDYFVIAPLVIAKNAESADVYLYQGAQVPEGQSDEWVQRHLETKMIASVDEVVAAVGPAATGDTSEAKPAQRRSPRDDG